MKGSEESNAMPKAKWALESTRSSFSSLAVICLQDFGSRFCGRAIRADGLAVPVKVVSSHIPKLG
jgi:hypothetical protein